MNPLLLDVPFQIETERLLLRAPRNSGDGKIVNEAIKDSFKELKPWLPFAQKLPGVEETEENLREAHANFIERVSFRFLIFPKDSKDLIGIISFESVNWDIPKCEIGYWINTKFSGYGYITEAAKELTNFGLNKIRFKRIEIRCESENLKSRSIPEKIGYELEGILKNDDLSADGSKLTDTCIYAIIGNMDDLM